MAHYKLAGLFTLSIIQVLIETLFYFLSVDSFYYFGGLTGNSMLASRIQQRNDTPSFYDLALTKLRYRSSFYGSFCSVRPVCQKRHFFSYDDSTHNNGSRSDLFIEPSYLSPSFELLFPNFVDLRTKVDKVSNITPIHHQSNYVWNESFSVEVNEETLPLIINFKNVDNKGRISLLGFVSFSLHSLDFTKPSMVKIPLQHGNGHVLLQIVSSEFNNNSTAPHLMTIPSIDLTNYVTGYDGGRFPRTLESIRRGEITSEESAYYDTIYDSITIDEIYEKSNTGDLILFSGNEISSFVVEQIFETTWSHVGMLLKNPPIDLLVEYGVDSVYYSRNESIFYIDVDDSYSSKRKGGGIQILPLREVIENSFSKDPNALLTYRKLIVLSSHQLNYTEMYQFISNRRSSLYKQSYLQCMHASTRTNTEIDENDMFCSEFIGACLKKLNLMHNSVRTNNLSTLDLSSEMNLIHSFLLKGTFYETERRIKKFN